MILTPIKASDRVADYEKPSLCSHLRLSALKSSPFEDAGCVSRSAAVKPSLGGLISASLLPTSSSDTPRTL